MSPGPAGVYAVCIISPILGTLAVAARFWVRRFKKAKFGLDDWTILPALIVGWAMSAVIIAGVSKGLYGGHTRENPVTHSEILTLKEAHQTEYQWIFISLLPLALGFTKMSVLFLYQRLFEISKLFRRYSNLLIIVTALWSISFFFARLFDCGVHFSALWTSIKDVDEFCDSNNASEAAFSIFDILLDLMILSAPIPIVLRLHMSNGEKLGICLVFALGLISTAAAITRTTLVEIVDHKQALHAFQDFLGYNTNLAVADIVEVGAAVIGACLPTLRPFFQKQASRRISDSIRWIISLRYHGNHSTVDSERYEHRDIEAVTGSNAHLNQKESDNSLKDRL